MGIERDSRTTDRAVSYRLVIPLDEDLDEWTWSRNLSTSLFEPDESIDVTRGQHILGNLSGAQPPAKPGACEPIAVARDEEINVAVGRIEEGILFTFVSGELGFGKSFFLRWLRDRVASWAATSIIDLSTDVNFNDVSTVVTELRSSLQTPRSLAGQSTNGLNEMWDGFLSGMAKQVESDFEEQGFELKEPRVRTAAVEGVQTWLCDYSIGGDIVDSISEIAADHYSEKPRTPRLSTKYPDTKITEYTALDFLTVLAALAEYNGYRLVLCVDELEKSYRTAAHFDNLYEFIEGLPRNVSLFVSGTPELLEGGGDEASIKGNHGQLYNLCTDNVIQLKELSESDLVEFLQRILTVEEAIRDHGGELGTSNYTTQVEELGGVNNAVEEYLNSEIADSRGFRGLLRFLTD